MAGDAIAPTSIKAVLIFKAFTLQPPSVVGNPVGTFAGS
jgi:hypothetical protein